MQGHHSNHSGPYIHISVHFESNKMKSKNTNLAQRMVQQDEDPSSSQWCGSSGKSLDEGKIS